MENFNVPMSLSDISLGQYQRYLAVSKEWGENIDEKVVSETILGIFCGVNDINTVDYSTAKVAVAHILELFNEETPLKRFFYFTGKDKKGNKTKVDFGFIPKLDDISLGEFIDLEGFMGDWSTMHKAMNVLFRPIKKSRVSRWFRLKTTYYTIQDYDGKGVYEENMKDMPLDVALGAVVFFYRLGTKLLQTTTHYIQQEIQDNNTQLRQTLEAGGVGIHQLNNLLEEMSLNLKKQQNLIYTQPSQI